MASASESQQDSQLSLSFALKCSYPSPDIPRSQERISGERVINHTLVPVYQMVGRLTDTPEDLKRWATGNKAVPGCEFRLPTCELWLPNVASTFCDCVLTLLCRQGTVSTVPQSERFQ